MIGNMKITKSSLQEKNLDGFWRERKTPPLEECYVQLDENNEVIPRNGAKDFDLKTAKSPYNQ